MASPALPNSLAAISRRVAEGRVSAAAVWAMLFVRSGLALGFQCLFAVVLWWTGAADPWRAAADWWLASFALGELVNLGMLMRLTRAEGIRYRDLFAVRRDERKRDIGWVVLAIVVSGPLGFLPNLALGVALWGDAQVGADLMFRSLPIPAVWLILIGFPLVHAITELPTYLGYVLPRLQALTGRRVAPALACAVVLSTQHIFLPLLFDWRFVIWRLFMFLPFALWLTWIVERRPTTLRYLVVAHYLLDFQLPVMVLIISMKAAG